MNEHDITVFAETNFRGVRRRFGVKRNDRRRHMYVIGKTGMGKTTLLENMTIQDIQAGEGVGIVDPHGEYAERMLDFVPASRINDVIYFNPSDTENPIAFNVMEDVGPERRHLVSSGLLGVFKKIWGPEVWSGRMEYLLSNSILALLETPGTTLLGINRILADKEYRKQIVANVKDPIVRAFWENEYAKYSDKFATEAGAAVQNKIGQFTSNPLIRNIIGQPKSTMDMRKIMDEKKIFIVNLSKGRIGEENARLLGAMLITRLYLSAMTRVELEENKRSDFYLYVDEFQNFATESFANILSEARKYRLDLILAHQYVEQMDETVRAAVFGNVGTMLTFRVGATDAELLEKEFFPEFLAKDFVNLGFASIYLRLMIDGVASRPFSATTLPPVKQQDRSYKDEIITASRKIYGHERKTVDKEIIDWQGLTKSMNQAGIASEKNYAPRKEFRAAQPFSEVVLPRQNERSQSQQNFRALSTQPLRRESSPAKRDMSSASVVNAADKGQKETILPQIRSYEPAKDENNRSVLDMRPPRRNEINIRQSTGEIIAYPKRVASELPKTEPKKSDISRARQVFEPQFKKTESFMSLSSLHPKAVKSAASESKKTINFTELKKVLADSFTPKKNTAEESSIGMLRDRTGMLKPRDATPQQNKSETQILKPGDKITFK